MSGKVGQEDKSARPRLIRRGRAARDAAFPPAENQTETRPPLLASGTCAACCNPWRMAWHVRYAAAHHLEPLDHDSIQSDSISEHRVLTDPTRLGVTAVRTIIAAPGLAGGGRCGIKGRRAIVSFPAIPSSPSSPSSPSPLVALAALAAQHAQRFHLYPRRRPRPCRYVQTGSHCFTSHILHPHHTASTRAQESTLSPLYLPFADPQSLDASYLGSDGTSTTFEIVIPLTDATDIGGITGTSASFTRTVDPDPFSSRRCADERILTPRAYICIHFH